LQPLLIKKKILKNLQDLQPYQLAGGAIVYRRTAAGDPGGKSGAADIWAQAGVDLVWMTTNGLDWLKSPAGRLESVDRLASGDEEPRRPNSLLQEVFTSNRPRDMPALHEQRSSPPTRRRTPMGE
jgi:hypothetical protein